MRSHWMFRCLAMALLASTVSAQTPEDVAPESAYSRGAGAYFAGRADQAEKYLTAAIEYAPDDPRAYYLRGLNYLSIGDTQKAQADLAEGARLEARMGSASPLVDRSLASVQGSARMTLERIRRHARESAKIQEQRSAALARKKAREQQEQRVLRTDFQLPMEALASRLTVDQARRVAIKDQSSEANLLAVVDVNDSSSQAADASSATSNPFADDPFTGGQVANTTAEPGDASSGGAEVPAAAEGSVKAGSLFGILSRVGNRAMGVSATAKNLAGQAMGPGGGPSPFGPGSGDFGGGGGGFEDGGFDQGGFGDGGFEQGEFSNGGFDGGQFGEPPMEEGATMEEDDANPFDFAE